MQTTLPPIVSKPINQCILVPAGNIHLLGDLQVPHEARALVVFAHGCGRSRNNPRTRRTAQMFRSIGIGTLLCELLTESEEVDDESSCRYRHDAELLAERLALVTEWAQAHPDLKKLPIGLFGACAGGAAAAMVAAKMHERIGALVSRGGLMDLAAPILPMVKCPTLLIVGDQDADGLQFNRDALPLLNAPKELLEIEGASHLFGEPGKLDEMSQLSAEWFNRHMIESRVAPDGGSGAAGKK
jgi:predicted alpha/beta-hydrolase family hydrolase